MGKLSVAAWVAFAVIAVDVYLVEPKASEDELVIQRSFWDWPWTRQQFS